MKLVVIIKKKRLYEVKFVEMHDSYGHGHGFQGSALPVLSTESPITIPIITNAKVSTLLSDNSSIWFILTPLN